MSPVQVRGEVLSLRRVGAYTSLTMVAPGIAEQSRPGHFVALAVGGEDTSHAAAAGVLHLPGAGARGVRRHGGDRLRRARARHRAG